ncbi:MAG TPA: acyloxyacyl hydrolase [Ramlibacter sp.]
MRRIAARLSIAAFALAAAFPSLALDGPTSVFAQAGAWTHVRSATLGLTWDWGWRREYSLGTLTGYTEVALGRWRTNGRAVDKGFTQFGVTPVFRFYPGGIAAGWFAELAVGANVITPKYRNDTRVFSSTFNFGDHVGVGRRFGANASHELALRFQHFSNAGISHPNPGENFVQLRYAYRF